MSIYKRGNKWRVEIRKKGFEPIYGTFEDKLEAQRFEAEQKLLLRNPSSIIKGHTLDEALKRYADEVSVHKAGERWENIRLNKYSRSSIALLPVEMITVDDINLWINQLSKTLKPNSIRRDLTLLSGVFEYAIKWRWCTNNPVRKADKPKADEHRDRRISDDEIKAILYELSYDDESPIVMSKQAIAVSFLIAIETAMRQGEIYSLTWDRVFLTERYVHLNKTKNGKKRDVPLTKRAIFLLEKLKGQHRDKVFDFRQASGEAQFRQAVRRAKIDDLHFHDSRHEAASRLAKIFSMLELAKITGHSDPRNLMVYYNPTASELASKLD